MGKRETAIELNAQAMWRVSIMAEASVMEVLAETVPDVVTNELWDAIATALKRDFATLTAAGGCEGINREARYAGD